MGLNEMSEETKVQKSKREAENPGESRVTAPTHEYPLEKAFVCFRMIII